MAANNIQEILTSQVIATDTTTVSNSLEQKLLPTKATEIFVISTVSARSDGTFTTTLQHSPDGTNWYTLKAAAAQSANGTVIAEVTAGAMHYVRASVLSASTSDGATVEVKVIYANKR